MAVDPFRAIAWGDDALPHQCKKKNTTGINDKMKNFR
jgi:hypothetical protein